MKLNVARVGISPNNTGTLLPVNQTTLSNTAQGFWEYGAISMASDLAVGQGIIMNGMMLLPMPVLIPLPTAVWMGLSVLGGMVMLRLLRMSHRQS